MASKTLTLYLVHPNANLSLVNVTFCYLFLLLLLFAQRQDWLYRIASNLQYLIVILVCGCETDLNTVSFTDMSTFLPDDRMQTL